MKKTYDSDEIEEAIKEAEYDSISGYLEKTKRIKKEINRLKKLFSKIDENKKKLVFATIEDVAFMSITMQDLREKIVREGTTVKYKNGENQYGTKQSPDAQLYLQLSQKLTQAIKLLNDCLPKTPDKPPEKDDGFDDFVNGREDV
jgi:alanyl-tRNA synthetase